LLGRAGFTLLLIRNGMMGWGDLSCLCSRNGDKRQSRIGDTPEKPNDNRRGTQASPAASRGLVGQAIVPNETLPVRHSDRFVIHESIRPGIHDSMRPGMGLVPSQDSQNQMKYVSGTIATNLPAANGSPSISYVSKALSTKTTLDHDTAMTSSNMKKQESECKGVNIIPDTFHNSSDENTIRFSV
jgi:hypothetical protein